MTKSPGMAQIPSTDSLVILAPTKTIPEKGGVQGKPTSDEAMLAEHISAANPPSDGNSSPNGKEFTEFLKTEGSEA